MRFQIWTTVFAVLFIAHAFAADSEFEHCRRHATPSGWSEDIDASIKVAHAAKKDLFVYFPMYYDIVGVGDKSFSTLRAWTNPEATAKLAENYVLVFWPWNHRELLGRPKNHPGADRVFNLLSPTWQKVHGYTGGITPRMLIVKPDASLVFAFSSSDMVLEREGEGLAFATKRLPKLRRILEKYYPVRRKVESMKDEEQIATLLFDVIKEYDYAFVRTYFRDDIERMVKADKKGNLGIREKYPFCWLNGPLHQLRTDFWNARETKIREIQKENRNLSRKDAGLKATLAMQKEWEPKCRKLLRVADKVMPRLFDEVDRNELNWLKKEAEAHIKVWNGESNEVPFF